MLPLPPGGAAHLFSLAAVAALIGGLSAIERKGALQLMLSRPIVLAPVLGWALGDARGGLVLGVPLELLFLGGVNLGGSLPDNESLLAGALTSLVVPAGMAARTGVDPPLAALGLVLLFSPALFRRRLQRPSQPRHPQLMEAALAREVRRVSTGSLLRVFWRSLFLQAAWNPRGMQNVGFADAIEPALEELYPDRAARAKATARHLEFFNCHPYLAAAILGGAVRLEERVAAGEAPPESVSSFKTALGPPFAALGDGFFWLALRPVAALAAAATPPFLGMGCVLVFLVLYHAVHPPVRLWLFATRYLRAEGGVDAVARAHLASGTPVLKTWGAALARAG